MRIMDLMWFFFVMKQLLRAHKLILYSLNLVLLEFNVNVALDECRIENSWVNSSHFLISKPPFMHSKIHSLLDFSAYF